MSERVSERDSATSPHVNSKSGSNFKSILFCQKERRSKTLFLVKASTVLKPWFPTPKWIFSWVESHGYKLLCITNNIKNKKPMKNIFALRSLFYK